VRLLLDTRLLLWTVDQYERLSRQARRLIGDRESEPVFSTASLWEVAIKYALRRADFHYDPRALRRALLHNEYRELPITGEHAVAVTNLPPLHRDPFDRILIAQCIVEGITLLTADPLVAQYPAPVRRV
jgi:PIN domain nuclease of toxin-antitoxin system